jgi:hypothetical protein
VENGRHAADQNEANTSPESGPSIPKILIGFGPYPVNCIRTRSRSGCICNRSDRAPATTQKRLEASASGRFLFLFLLPAPPPRGRSTPEHRSSNSRVGGSIAEPKAKPHEQSLPACQFVLGPFRARGLQIIPETWLTLHSGPRGFDSG